MTRALVQRSLAGEFLCGHQRWFNPDLTQDPSAGSSCYIGISVESSDPVFMLIEDGLHYANDS